MCAHPFHDRLPLSVINVLTCIIDAWHYDNGSESTQGEWGWAQSECVVVGDNGGEGGVTVHDWTLTDPHARGRREGVYSTPRDIIMAKM